jgi:hypothetical protein
MAGEPETGSTRITPSNASVADADITNPMFVCLMLDRLRKAGAEQEIEDLLARDPAGELDDDDDDGGGVVTLAWSLHNAGADDQVTTLLTRLSAAGKRSLLDEIGEATGLPVPQKD